MAGDLPSLLTGRVLHLEGHGTRPSSCRTELWTTHGSQGWKASVKAKHLVMALRDHFAEPGDDHNSVVVATRGTRKASLRGDLSILSR